jgi:hypothetical protein
MEKLKQYSGCLLSVEIGESINGGGQCIVQSVMQMKEFLKV